MELRYGSVEDGGYDDWIPIAYISAPKGNIFYVQFLIESIHEQHKKALEVAKRELNFYLIERGYPDPWAYAQYHCGTAADIYSTVHWSFFSSTKKVKNKITF